MVTADKMLDGVDRMLLAQQMREHDALMIEMAETIREAAWNLCKAFDTRGQRRDRTILTNYVSAELERQFGTETENFYREEWLAEVKLFCRKYGYGGAQ